MKTAPVIIDLTESAQTWIQILGWRTSNRFVTSIPESVFNQLQSFGFVEGVPSAAKLTERGMKYTADRWPDAISSLRAPKRSSELDPKKPRKVTPKSKRLR